VTLLRIEKNIRRRCLKRARIIRANWRLCEHDKAEVWGLTNIGRDILEFFGDLAGVVQEEGRLAELLPADGTLFVNGDMNGQIRL